LAICETEQKIVLLSSVGLLHLLVKYHLPANWSAVFTSYFQEGLCSSSIKWKNN